MKVPKYLILDGGINYIQLEGESKEDYNERIRRECIEIYGYDPDVEDPEDPEGVLALLRSAIND